jgi:radical SAM-linked protein
MVRDKLRIRFRKAGDLRLTSHHDLMRCFERMLRRAALPFHCTQGFNPKPRLVFALPLPLGITGWDEVVDLELDAELPPEAVRDRLARECPPGLEVVRVQRINPGVRSHVRGVTYRIAVPPEKSGQVPERVADLLAAETCWIDRIRPKPRRFDLRPYLDQVRLLPGALEMDLRVTPHGTARPEEVLALLGLSDLLADGAILERTRLELEDECDATRSATVVAGSGMP